MAGGLTTGSGSAGRPARAGLAAFAPWAAWLVLAIPTMFRLADLSWSRDFGAYGPIILGTGGWLLWRQAADMRREAEPVATWIPGLILAASLASYVFGRAYDFLFMEAGGVYGAGLALLLSQLGVRPMLKHWFPLLYLGFSVPPPPSVLADVTSPLKEFVSHIATNWVNGLGIPAAREGVTIFVAQYQLLVEDACSGMNSIVGLTAVSLLYIYLIRGSSVIYSVVLVGLVIPIAIFANILRIMILIMLTYFYGDEVAQGFLHFTAGMFLFATALVCVFFIDRLLAFIGGKLRRRA